MGDVEVCCPCCGERVSQWETGGGEQRWECGNCDARGESVMVDGVLKPRHHWSERVAELTAERDDARHRLLVADVLLQQVLSGSLWHEQGHPGEPCHRTAWVPDERLSTWRDVAEAITREAP